MQSNLSVPIKLKKVTLRADKSYTPGKTWYNKRRSDIKNEK